MRRLMCIDSPWHVRYRQREYFKINDHLRPQGTYTLKKQTDPETFHTISWTGGEGSVTGC